MELSLNHTMRLLRT